MNEFVASLGQRQLYEHCRQEDGTIPLVLDFSLLLRGKLHLATFSERLTAYLRARPWLAVTPIGAGGFKTVSPREICSFIEAPRGSWSNFLEYVSAHVSLARNSAAQETTHKPLIKFIRRAKDIHVLVVVANHYITDAIGIRNLTYDLLAIIDGRWPLKTKCASYLDNFIIEEGSTKSYWDELINHPRLLVPKHVAKRGVCLRAAGERGGAMQNDSCVVGKSFLIELDQSRVKCLCRQYRCTPFIFFLSHFICSYFGASDSSILRIGVQIDLRPNGQGAVPGCFSYQFPLQFERQPDMLSTVTSVSRTVYGLPGTSSISSYQPVLGVATSLRRSEIPSPTPTADVSLLQSQEIDLSRNKEDGIESGFLLAVDSSSCYCVMHLEYYPDELNLSSSVLETKLLSIFE